MEDRAALEMYVQTGSSQALTALAERYFDLIYSAALRQVRDVHLAEDVTQNVLLVLMKKAHRISRATPIAAWLLKVTHYVALDTLKINARRKGREQVVARAESDASNLWPQIEPLLDGAVQRLRPMYRSVVVLKFFEGKNSDQIASQLNISEQAVRKRVSRAIQHLRRIFAADGITADETMLEAVIVAHVIHSAPPGIATLLIAGLKQTPKRLVQSAATTKLILFSTMIGCATIATVVTTTKKSSSPPIANVTIAPVPILQHQQPQIPRTLTPLIYAAIHNNVAQMRNLLNQHAAINEISRDGNNMPALMYSVEMFEKDASLDAVKLLVDQGADVNARQSQWGYTPLMIAVRKSSPKTAAYLLEHGADPMMTDFSARTVLDFAKMNNDPSLIKFAMNAQAQAVAKGARASAQ